ncbi:hypothetical protein QBC46DRAFT_433042 [Diplogelasinospora grovesii]|uniref:JmjC domain-containing protein n=1 Tax=Diplogelasinospora grovesii TaxID=303347 RepID=A0AAN6MUA7_9PEZI|nr:hypothetical protein QBC46DRAFT_433042 [Diplogelasinospora grovesii]
MARRYLAKLSHTRCRFRQPAPSQARSASPSLKRRGGGNLAGINSPYEYFSISGGPTITICHKEDGLLGSKNVVSGENKVLIVIKPSANTRFEDCMYKRFPDVRRDSQGIRHIGRAVAPSLLDEWEIEYDIASFAPGQGFATLPGDVYHMVINMGDNLALAIN